MNRFLFFFYMVKIWIEWDDQEGDGTLKREIGMLTVLILFLIGFLFFEKSADGEEKAQILSTDNQIKVILQLFYLDGEVQEEITIEDPANLEQLWWEYRDWTLVDIDTQQVVFKKTIDDISPMLKANGYFGLTEDGTLSVFNGKPRGTNVIHTLFQIDIERMESKTLKQLKEGIPVRDKEQFIKMINAFKPYSQTKAE